MIEIYQGSYQYNQFPYSKKACIQTHGRHSRILKYKSKHI